MEVKLFEVRDKGTFIPMIAIQLGGRNEAERWLLDRAGYGTFTAQQRNYILLAGLDDGDDRITYNPCKWDETLMRRTRRVAHEHIQHHWHALDSGDVIDVEFILGETKSKKKSERPG